MTLVTLKVSKQILFIPYGQLFGGCFRGILTKQYYHTAFLIHINTMPKKIIFYLLLAAINDAYKPILVILEIWELSFTNFNSNFASFNSFSLISSNISFSDFSWASWKFFFYIPSVISLIIHWHCTAFTLPHPYPSQHTLIVTSVSTAHHFCHLLLPVLGKLKMWTVKHT